MSPADWRAAITGARRRLARIARSRRANTLGSNFNCADQESSSWEERGILAVDLLRNRLVSCESPERPLLIGDFGAGNERLRRILGEHLGAPHDYRGYDLNPQQSATTRIDLEHELPSQAFDVVFCLGLLEYLHEPAQLLSRLSSTCDTAVLSYALFDGPERLTAAERRARGWVTDLTRDDVQAMLENAGFRQVDFRTANRERTGIWLVRSARGQVTLPGARRAQAPAAEGRS